MAERQILPPTIHITPPSPPNIAEPQSLSLPIHTVQPKKAEPQSLPTLPGIPPVVVNHILQYTSRSEILSVRSTCRELRSKAAIPFGNEFFGIVRIRASGSRFTRLQGIRRLGYAESVKTLELSVDPSCLPDQVRNVRFLDNLFALIKPFPRLRWITIDVPDCTKALAIVVESDNAWSAFIHTVLETVREYDIHLEGFQFRCSSSEGHIDARAHPSSFLPLARNLQLLDQLNSLALNMSTEPGLTSHTPLIAILKNATKLSSLSLSLDIDESSDNLINSITQPLRSIPSLRRLSLLNMRFESPTLLARVTSIGTLQRIHLSSITIQSGNWSEVFETLLCLKELQEVSLDSLFEQNRRFSFQKVHYEGRDEAVSLHHGGGEDIYGWIGKVREEYALL